MEKTLGHTGLSGVGIHPNGGAVDHELCLGQGRFQGVRIKRVVFNVKRRAFTEIARQGVAFFFFDRKDREPADGGLKRESERNGPCGASGSDNDCLFPGKFGACMP